MVSSVCNLHAGKGNEVRLHRTLKDLDQAPLQRHDLSGQIFHSVVEVTDDWVPKQVGEFQSLYLNWKL